MIQIVYNSCPGTRCASVGVDVDEVAAGSCKLHPESTLYFAVEPDPEPEPSALFADL